jgi:nicotinamidase-related amidase
VRLVEIPAEHAAISLDLDRTALLVIDMQNAFGSPGGMLDLAGVDIRPARDVIANAQLVCGAARRAGLPVIYLTMGYPADQSTAGGADSPNPQKELALCLMRERPELRGQLLTIGTWDFQVVRRALTAGDRHRNREIALQRLPWHGPRFRAARSGHAKPVDGGDRIQRLRRVDHS